MTALRTPPPPIAPAVPPSKPPAATVAPLASDLAHPDPLDLSSAVESAVSSAADAGPANFAILPNFEAFPAAVKAVSAVFTAFFADEPVGGFPPEGAAAGAGFGPC